MVGFTDKFKSLVSQAQQKVTDIQDSEKFKDLIGQVQEGVSLAQTKIEEIKANAERERLEAIKSAEKQKLDIASTQASEHKYQQAVILLEKVPNSSEFYTEAQQRILEYVQASHEYVMQQSALMIEQDFYDDAITLLKKIPDSSNIYDEAQRKIVKCISNLHECAINQSSLMIEQGLYNEAILSLEAITKRTNSSQVIQEKIAEYVSEFELSIKNHKNIIPLHHRGRIVAAAFIDQTLHLVDSIERKQFIGNQFSMTQADGEFLIVRLIIRNDGKKTRTISASAMKIIDSQEREYRSSTSGGTALVMSGDKNAEFSLSEIHPDLPKTITIVFDLPVGKNDLNLKISSGGLGGSAILPLSLAI